MAKRGKAKRSPIQRKRKVTRKPTPRKPKLKRKRVAKATKRRLTRVEQRERARLEQESIKLSEREAKKERARVRLARYASRELVDTLVDAYERMVDDASDAGVDFNLTVHHAPSTKETKRKTWLVLGRFRPTHAVTYVELGQVFFAWMNDLILEAQIHPDRLAWIRWEYQRKDERGRKIGDIEGYAEAGSGPWSFIISENAYAAGDAEFEDADALQSRYPLTEIAGGGVSVYFSAELARDYFRAKFPKKQTFQPTAA